MVRVWQDDDGVSASQPPGADNGPETLRDDALVAALSSLPKGSWRPPAYLDDAAQREFMGVDTLPESLGHPVWDEEP